MADADDDTIKTCCHGNNMLRQMNRHTSIRIAFRLLVSFAFTTIIVEAIFLLTGVLYLSASPLSDVTIRSTKNASVTSWNVLRSLNGIASDSLVQNGSKAISKDGTISPQSQTKLESKLTLRQQHNSSAVNVTTSMTSTNNSNTPAPATKTQDNKVYFRVLVHYFITLESLCSAKIPSMPEAKRKLACPCISPFLEGHKPVQQENLPTIGELELTLTQLEDGGYFKPSSCYARHKVSIIVPFRDREEHLNIFLNLMHNFLQKQLIEYRIFVVEEVPHKIFNKAMMMNIGFVEAMKLFPDTDCVVFHDVDMLPEDDRNLYACADKPRHMGAFVDKWKYNLPYLYLVGGAISLTPEQFRLVNGYSNEFFGWGGEDDDFYQRMKSRGLYVVRYPKEVSKYTMLKHFRDKFNPINSKRGVSVKWRPKHYEENGLNSLKYVLKSIENRPLYTWIQADIDVPK